MKLLYGDAAARDVSGRVGAPVATLTVLKQTPADRRVDGQVFHVLADDTWWHWNDQATATGDDVLAVTPNDAPSAGRFMRMPGQAMIALTFYATTPSGTALLTVPSNTIIDLGLGNIGVAVSRRFTGVATSLAGLSSSNFAGHTGAFNIVGSLIATQLDNWFSPTAAGTGADFLMAPIPSGVSDVGRQAVRPWLKGGDTLRYDGGGWGTGVGQFLLAAQILKNPGV